LGGAVFVALTPEEARQLAPRFWPKVVRSEGCWLWTGAQVAAPGAPPYGSFRITERTSIRAHRFSWILHFGEIPDDLIVCHTCDVRLCVRPDHLFLGTHIDNVRDRDAKGRAGAARGVEQPGSRLTDEAVRELRALYAAGGVTQRELAEYFDVSQGTVSRAWRGEHWKHVT
jgi:HNH endonuclease